MEDNKNYIWNTPKFLLIVMALLMAMSWIPAYKSENVTIRQVDMLSDLFKDGETDGSDILASVSADLEEMLMAASVVVDTTVVHDSVASAQDSVAVVTAPPYSPTPGIVQIEDFSEDGDALSGFFSALDNIDSLGRPLRIAFVGDSFTEGDIITSDMRELLQSRFGGRGVGFIPAVPSMKFRNTLVQDHKGWKTYSMINYKSADRSKLLINGQYFVPSGGARISAKATSSKPCASSWSRVEMLYYSGDNTSGSVDFRVNGDGGREYVCDIEAGSGLSLHELGHDEDITSFDCTFNADSMFVYGLFLNDGEGVYVDNMSLRSSSGLTLSITSRELLRNLNTLVKYDLVILQYGLNIAEPDRTSYTGYKDRMVSTVNYLKAAMPDTDFLVFGISDRNFRDENGDVKTMPGIVSMVSAQREIARETGVAFWNTFLAMGGPNSMKKFVENDPPLANKDYTHISYAGGRRIAEHFVQSLMDARPKYWSGAEY